MTTRRLLIPLVGVAVIAAAAACGTPTKPAASSEAVTTPPATSAAVTTTSSGQTSTVAAGPSACDELQGTVGPDQVCSVHTETAGSPIDMSFPATYPDQRALADVLTKQRDQFISAIEDPPVSPMPKALDIKSTSYRAGAPDTPTESLVLEEYWNLGGAHPTTSYNALNYDLTKKAPITFDTLFKPGTDPVAVLDPIVETELKNRLEGAPVDANPIGPEMYKNFALTDDAVIIFISQGQWTIEAAGAQQVSIPRSQLAAILA